METSNMKEVSLEVFEKQTDIRDALKDFLEVLDSGIGKYKGFVFDSIKEEKGRKHCGIEIEVDDYFEIIFPKDSSNENNYSSTFLQIVANSNKDFKYLLIHLPNDAIKKAVYEKYQKNGVVETLVEIHNIQNYQLVYDVVACKNQEEVISVLDIVKNNLGIEDEKPKKLKPIINDVTTLTINEKDVDFQIRSFKQDNEHYVVNSNDDTVFVVRQNNEGQYIVVAGGDVLQKFLDTYNDDSGVDVIYLRGNKQDIDNCYASLRIKEEDAIQKLEIALNDIVTIIG